MNLPLMQPSQIRCPQQGIRPDSTLFHIGGSFAGQRGHPSLFLNPKPSAVVLLLIFSLDAGLSRGLPPRPPSLLLSPFFSSFCVLWCLWFVPPPRWLGSTAIAPRGEKLPILHLSPWCKEVRRSIPVAFAGTMCYWPSRCGPSIVVVMSRHSIVRLALSRCLCA